MTLRSGAGRRRAWRLLLGFVALALAAPARGDDGPSAPVAPPPPTTAAPTASTKTSPTKTEPAVTRADLEARIRFLASDAMAGRFSTEPGAMLASQYVADEFERLGLEPRGTAGWFQPFEIAMPRLGADNTMEIVLPDARIPLTVEKDWNPFSMSPNREVTAPLVFAGYGVTNPEKGYDDFADAYDEYADVDVKGKALLVLRREPPWDAGPSKHATFLAKLDQAAKHGAAMLLVVNDPRSLGKAPDRLMSWKTQLGPQMGSGKIPFAFVSQDVAERLVKPFGKSLAELQRAIDEAAGGPKPIGCVEMKGVSVRLRTSIEKSAGPNARNVCGLLPGSDEALRHEVVVVGAHHDHVGRGQVGSAGGPADVGKVHPGADDNASGTAALLEIAQACATGAKRPRRSILFLSFSGEELGLLGSAYYVEHPTVALADMNLMVNCDMVGRYDAKRTMEIGGVGTGVGLQDLVTKANEPYGLVLTWDPSGVAPSDNTSFYRKRIPVLFFFTGLHEQYHTPRDTPDTINYVGAEAVTSLCLDTVRTLADGDERVVFTKPPPGGGGDKAALGIQAAQGSDSGGVVVVDVVADGAADGAGMKQGDVILAIGAYVVDSYRDLQRALSNYKPGNKVLVRIARGADHLSLEVVFGSRR